MTRRDAARVAKRFVRRYYPYHAEQWNFDIAPDGFDLTGKKKVWPFGLKPDEEHKDYEPYRTLVGYVRADGTVGGLY